MAATPRGHRRAASTRRRPAALALLAATLLVPFAPAAAQPEPGVGIIHQLDHAVRSRAGETIRIVNPFGNVRVRSIPDAARASLRVTVQSSREGPAPARLAASEHDGGPVYAVEAADPAGALIRADLVVALPDRAGLDVRLHDGDFAMHAAGYPVRLRARSGDVGLRTTGRVDVEVVSGRVVYNPPAGAAPAGGRIVTSAAPVDVLARHAGPLNFRVLSGSAVTTDSPALLGTRTRDGRAVLFGDHDEAAVLTVRTDHAPVRLVLEANR